MWIVEPLQLKNSAGAPSGTWHLVATSDEGGGIVPCCAHDHRTPAEATECAEARATADRVTGIHLAPARPVLAYGSDNAGGVHLHLGCEHLHLSGAQAAELAAGLLAEAARPPSVEG